MAKLKTSQIDSRKRYALISDFIDIIAILRSKQEIVNFLIGLLTPSESLMLARRIQIAKMLIEGHSYEKIRKDLHVSFQTISKAEKWINTGQSKYDQWLRKRLTKE